MPPTPRRGGRRTEVGAPARCGILQWSSPDAPEQWPRIRLLDRRSSTAPFLYYGTEVSDWIDDQARATKDTKTRKTRNRRAG